MDDGLVIRPSAAGSVVVSGGRDAQGEHPHAMIPFLRFGTYVTNMNTLRHPFLEEFRMAVFCRRLMPRCTWVKSGKGDESWSLFSTTWSLGRRKSQICPIVHVIPQPFLYILPSVACLSRARPVNGRRTDSRPSVQCMRWCGGRCGLEGCSGSSVESGGVHEW